MVGLLDHEPDVAVVTLARGERSHGPVDAGRQVEAERVIGRDDGAVHDRDARRREIREDLI
jgi:hypothetical protein